MKTFFSFVVMGLLVFSGASCASTSSSGEEAQPSAPALAQAQTPAEPPAPELVDADIVAILMARIGQPVPPEATRTTENENEYAVMSPVDDFTGLINFYIVEDGIIQGIEISYISVSYQTINRLQEEFYAVLLELGDPLAWDERVIEWQQDGYQIRFWSLFWNESLHAPSFYEIALYVGRYQPDLD